MLNLDSSVLLTVRYLGVTDSRVVVRVMGSVVNSKIYDSYFCGGLSERWIMECYWRNVSMIG